MKTWLAIRGILILSALLQGMLLDGIAPPPADSPVPILGVVFVFGIISILFVIGVQAFNFCSASVWRYPNWHLNPFLIKEPLQFFHFGGFYFLGLGFGVLLRHIFYTYSVGPDSFFLLSVASGVLVGVRVCTVVFHRKMSNGA